MKNQELNKQGVFDIAQYAKARRSEQSPTQFEVETFSQSESGKLFVHDNNVYPFV